MSQSYQVLARKYRPSNFHELVGQTHVSQALINAIDHNRLHHAYLFTGTRGVGKTTIARILAKCLNCDTGVTSTPCGVCNSCMTIEQGRFIDLIEIDAASRTKVEDTRELLDNVPYAPTQGRYKVYLIDEVHMLSMHSFNALLKTLEEPPEHVKFLLATTDPQKLPITIISRCLQFVLRPLAQEQLTQHLRNLLDKEQMAFEEPALWQLAHAAKGSVRDSLSLTDQAIAFGQGKLTEQAVNEMLGLINAADLIELLAHIYNDDRHQVAIQIEQMRQQMVDASNVFDELANLLHKIAMIQVLPNLDLNVSPIQTQAIASLAQQMSADVLQLYYEIVIKSRENIMLATTPMQALEMCLLRMLAFRPLPTNQLVINSVASTEVDNSKRENQNEQNGNHLKHPNHSNQQQPIEQVTQQPNQDINWQQSHVQEDTEQDDSDSDSDSDNNITNLALTKESKIAKQTTNDNDIHQHSSYSDLQSSQLNQPENYVSEETRLPTQQFEPSEHFENPQQLQSPEQSTALFNHENTLEHENALENDSPQFQTTSSEHPFQPPQADYPINSDTLIQPYDIEASNIQASNIEMSNIQTSEINKPTATDDLLNVIDNVTNSGIGDINNTTEIDAGNNDKDLEEIIEQPPAQMPVQKTTTIEQSPVTDAKIEDPRSLLRCPAQPLEGEWTAEKWDYWVQTAREQQLLDKDELAFARQGLMLGQCDGESRFITSLDSNNFQLLFEHMVDKLQNQFTHASYQLEAMDVNTLEGDFAVPEHRQKHRQQQAEQLAMDKLYQSIVMQALTTQGVATIKSIKLL